MQPAFEIALDRIPRADPEVRSNIRAMLEWIERGERTEVGDPDLQRFTSGVLRYSRLQLERLSDLLGREADLIAWIGRTLFELLIQTRYALSSRERLTEFLLLQVRDYQDLDRAWFQEEDADPKDEVASDFKKSLSGMEKALEASGYEIGGRHNLKLLAEKTESLGLYKVVQPTLSKYAHPTALVLFGRESFLFGSEAKNGVVVLSQFCAARLLIELPGLVKEMQSQSPMS